MGKIEHLPITNKDKFERVLYAGGAYRHEYRMNYEIKESFNLLDDFQMGGHRYTIHVCYKEENGNLLHEGIGLEWYNNPFNLDYDNDNFMRYEEIN